MARCHCHCRLKSRIKYLGYYLIETYAAGRWSKVHQAMQSEVLWFLTPFSWGFSCLYISDFNLSKFLSLSKISQQMCDSIISDYTRVFLCVCKETNFLFLLFLFCFFMELAVWWWEASFLFFFFFKLSTVCLSVSLSCSYLYQ